MYVPSWSQLMLFTGSAVVEGCFQSHDFYYILVPTV